MHRQASRIVKYLRSKVPLPTSSIYESPPFSEKSFVVPPVSKINVSEGDEMHKPIVEADSNVSQMPKITTIDVITNLHFPIKIEPRLKSNQKRL